jgi:hypothetical protein
MWKQDLDPVSVLIYQIKNEGDLVVISGEAQWGTKVLGRWSVSCAKSDRGRRTNVVMDYGNRTGSCECFRKVKNEIE